MKNVSLVLNVVLLIAVIVLYFLHFSGNDRSFGVGSVGEKTINPNARIVYINMDTLLNNYTQSRELNEAYLKKIENSRTELNVKVKLWAKDAEEFQKKVDNNGFVTRDRANQAYADIMVRKETLERQEQEMHETALREQQELNQKLYNILTAFLKEYNSSRGYEMILSTTLGGNVFYSADGFDITRDVVTQLNAQYASQTKK